MCCFVVTLRAGISDSLVFKSDVIFKMTLKYKNLQAPSIMKDYFTCVVALYSH